MQFPRACPPAFFCLLLVCSCARPIVSDEPEDAAAAVQVEDASVPEQPAEDAGEQPFDAEQQVEPPAPAPEPDASCADEDQDSVCDADDNCPHVSNPAQADADADGTGDACEAATPEPCSPASVPASVQAGEGRLSNVRVNGMASPVTVRKGQRLTVTLDYAFAEGCSSPIPGQPRSLVIGLEGQSAGSCSILPGLPCPPQVSGDTTLTVNAPNTAGPAYLVALGQEIFGCLSLLRNSQRIAAICVE